MTPPSRRPLGTESVKFNVPAKTMAALRKEAAEEGCSVTFIVNRVLNAYARGAIKQVFSQVG